MRQELARFVRDWNIFLGKLAPQNPGATLVRMKKINEGTRTLSQNTPTRLADDIS
jgi:hypothetical protein